jgi:hypothetical protein
LSALIGEVLYCLGMGLLGESNITSQSKSRFREVFFIFLES